MKFEIMSLDCLNFFDNGLGNQIYKLYQRECPVFSERGFLLSLSVQQSIAYRKADRGYGTISLADGGF